MQKSERYNYARISRRIKAVVVVVGGEGSRVLSADSGPAALELSEGAGGRIDLLLSDVDMPEMSGPNLGESLN